MRAPAGTSLTGLVTDLAGRPIAVARVDAYERRPALFPTIRGPSGEEPRFIDSRETDGEGRFAFCGLEPGPYSFRAYKQGFGDAVTGVTMLQEGKTAHKVLRLEKDASTAGGIVLDRRDRPVPGIIVSFIPDPIPEGMTMMPFNARSGSDGRFRISGLWNGVRHSISACDPDGRYVVPRADNLPEFVLPDGGDLEIRAYLAASVSGRVDALPAGSAPTIVLIEERRSGRGLTRRAAVKDENFRITGLAPGTYSVLARGKGLTEKNLGTVAVEEGERIENLVFHYGDSTCITGRVLMAGSGAPAGGLLVSLIDRAQHAKAVPGAPCSDVADESTTDREGGFRFAGVAPGCYDVAVWDLSKGYGSHRSAIVSDGETLSGLVIRLAEGALVKGLVQPDGLLPSRRASTLVFVNSDRLVRKCAADRLGAFTIRLVPGEYFWTAEKPGSNPDPRCLVIPPACQSLEVVLK